MLTIAAAGSIRGRPPPSALGGYAIRCRPIQSKGGARAVRQGAGHGDLQGHEGLGEEHEGAADTGKQMQEEKYGTTNPFKQMSQGLAEANERGAVASGRVGEDAAPARERHRGYRHYQGASRYGHAGEHAAAVRHRSRSTSRAARPTTRPYAKSSTSPAAAVPARRGDAGAHRSGRPAVGDDRLGVAPRESLSLRRSRKPSPFELR